MPTWLTCFLAALMGVAPLFTFGVPLNSTDNIILTSSKEIYRFEWNKKTSTVEVKGEIENNYLCRNYRDKAYFHEFFDDQTQLDGVELNENGKKSLPSKALSDYTIDDIFYSDAKVYNLELNFLKKDWQNIVKVKKTVKDPRYFCTVYFHEAYLTEEKKLVFVIPRWMKAELVEFNFEGYEIKKEKHYSETEDADIYTYILLQAEARKREPMQPGSSFIYPHLLVINKSATYEGNTLTFFNTLADQYKWYKKIVAMCKNDATIINRKAAEITKTATTAEEKIKAILYWVHENIRYIAFEDGIAGFKPDEAQNVLAKKYGDCKGMANLIKELLVASGLDARLAWIGTNNIKYDYNTPALCVDNHMICYLELNGKPLFLDGTEKYLPAGVYAERIQGRQVLVENGDGYLLKQIPVCNSDQNLCRFSEKMKLVDGALAGEVEYLYRGESKQQLFFSIHQSNKEKLEAQLERYISNNNKNYLVKNIKTTDLNQVDGDLKINFETVNAGAVSSFGDEIYIDIDYNKSFNKMVFDAERKNDYRFSIKHHYETETELEIPAGYKLSTLPPDISVNNDGYAITIKYSILDNVVRYKKQLYISNTYLARKDFNNWNQAIVQLSKNYQEQIILTKK